MKTSKLELMQSGLERRKESRPTECELAAAIKDAERLLDSHRAKRAAYHAKHHAFKQDGGNDQSHRIEFNLDFDRDENLSPQPLKTTMAGYLEQLETIKSQLSHIDLSKINTLSVSVQALQAKIDKAINSISIDQKQIQVLIQFQIKQAIESQAEFVQTEILSLLQSDRKPSTRHWEL